MYTVQHIIEHRLMAIIRGANPAEILRIVDALFTGGIRTLEITLNSPNALEVIEQVAAHAGSRMLIGAGTVLDSDTCRKAIDAGAQFIVSPTLDPATIETTKSLGAISVPGAFTPTEVLKAQRAGADLIKIFPASAVGPAFFREMAGPLPEIPLMPTGGVTLDNIAEYAKAGAKAFGIGSALTNTKEEVTDESLQKLIQRANEFRAALAL